MASPPNKFYSCCNRDSINWYHDSIYNSLCIANNSTNRDFEFRDSRVNLLYFLGRIINYLVTLNFGI